MRTVKHPYHGGVKHRTITQRHRLLIWENMLAAVYAMSPQGEVRYFDYDYEAARAFAKVTECTDLRISKKRQPVSYTGQYCEPRVGATCLWGVCQPRQSLHELCDLIEKECEEHYDVTDGGDLALSYLESGEWDATEGVAALAARTAQLMLQQ